MWTTSANGTSRVWEIGDIVDALETWEGGGVSTTALEAPIESKLPGRSIQRRGSLGSLSAVPRRPLFGQLQCQVIKPTM